METDSYISDNADHPAPPRGLQRRPIFWVLMSLPPVAAGAVSWILGGNTAWGWGLLGGAAVLFLIVIGALKLAPQMQARHWVRLGYTLGYLGLVWAVWWGVGYYFPLTVVAIELSKDRYEQPMRITYRGAEIGEFDAGADISFPTRGQFNPASLKVETLGPDGWFPCRFHHYGSHVALDDETATTLYIDNRKATPVRVEFGEIRLDIPAQSHSRHAFRIPPIGGVIRLYIDGQKIGRADDGHYLIDVEGTHTYRLQAVVYGGGLVAIFNPNAGARVPPPEIYRGAHLHHLSRPVDFFLEKPPETIKGFGSMTTEERWQLAEGE